VGAAFTLLLADAARFCRQHAEVVTDAAAVYAGVLNELIP
jgi:hypothetical protein